MLSSLQLTQLQVDKVETGSGEIWQCPYSLSKTSSVCHEKAVPKCPRKIISNLQEKIQINMGVSSTLN